MGKRKSSAKPAPKKRMDKLDTVFCCPFCNHGSSVECTIDMKNMIGEAICGICQESFSTTATSLTEAIDISKTALRSCRIVRVFDPTAEKGRFSTVGSKPSRAPRNPTAPALRMDFSPQR